MDSKVTLFDKTFKPYIPHEQIIAAIDRMAEEVNRDFRDSQDIPIILCILNGSIPFTSELMQRLEFNCQLVCIKMSSYSGTQSTGTVVSVTGFTADVSGRRVIICEDIVESGNTIIALKEMLAAKGATDVKICTMLFKPGCYHKSDRIDYVAMDIDDDFIVGFGLDYNELGRNLKDIYIIDNN